MGAKRKAAEHTGNAREHIDRQVTDRSKRSLDLYAEHVCGVGVKGQMDKANVYKDRRDQSPDLPGDDPRVDLGAKAQQYLRVCAASGSSHGQPDQDIEANDRPGDNRGMPPQSNRSGGRRRFGALRYR